MFFMKNCKTITPGITYQFQNSRSPHFQQMIRFHSSFADGATEEGVLEALKARLSHCKENSLLPAYYDLEKAMELITELQKVFEVSEAVIKAHEAKELKQAQAELKEKEAEQRKKEEAIKAQNAERNQKLEDLRTHKTNMVELQKKWKAEREKLSKITQAKEAELKRIEVFETAINQGKEAVKEQSAKVSKLDKAAKAEKNAGLKKTAMAEVSEEKARLTSLQQTLKDNQEALKGAKKTLSNLKKQETEQDGIVKNKAEEMQELNKLITSLA